MKKSVLTMVAVLSAFAVCAQSESDFKAQYERQVKAMGASGMGVEYILKKWETAFPESPDVQEAKFNYYFDKSRTEEMVGKTQMRFMGAEPVLFLTDSLGGKINYFRESFYNDELFGAGIQAMEKAIELRPDELSYRFGKITALLAYEKESPDMATDELKRLIDYNVKNKPSWKAMGEDVDEEYFVNAVQEYCYTFFRIASPDSYESFRTISEKMSKLYPSNTVFLSNLGSYWLVAMDSHNTALRYYRKVLKINPRDYSAIKNCVLMARKDKNVKLEKQYLPLLIEVTDSQSEKISAEARLKQL